MPEQLGHSELAIRCDISHETEIELCSIASECLNRHAGVSDLNEAFDDLKIHYNHITPIEYTFLMFIFSIGVTKLSMNSIPNISMN